MTITDDGGAGLALVEELHRRFRAGGGAAVGELLHPDFTVEQPPSLPHGGRHAGLEGMVAMGGTFAEHWERTISPPEVVATGDCVVQRTTQTWTAHRTGRAATVDVVELISFADGLILGIRVFPQDTHLLLATLDEPT